MRSVAYALLGFGVLAFGTLTTAPASADEYGPIHHHVRHHHPVHHHVHQVPDVQYHASSCCGHYLPPACCGHSYYHHAYYVRPAYFRPYVEDSVPFEDVGYGDYSPNGYYVSGLGGYGGAYRGLVSWHRYGHYDAGRHGYVGYRHAGYGGYRYAGSRGFHRFR